MEGLLDVEKWCLSESESYSSYNRKRGEVVECALKYPTW